MNAIWRVRHSRAWTRKFTDYLSVVLVGPLLVFAATGVIASAESHWIVQKILEIPALGSLFVWTAKVAPFFLLSGAFIFLHKFPYFFISILLIRLLQLLNLEFS